MSDSSSSARAGGGGVHSGGVRSSGVAGRRGRGDSGGGGGSAGDGDAGGGGGGDSAPPPKRARGRAEGQQQVRFSLSMRTFQLGCARVPLQLHDSDVCRPRRRPLVARHARPTCLLAHAGTLSAPVRLCDESSVRTSDARTLCCRALLPPHAALPP
jgi:hypothetical protein